MRRIDPFETEMFIEDLQAAEAAGMFNPPSAMEPANPPAPQKQIQLPSLDSPQFVPPTPPVMPEAQPMQQSNPMADAQSARDRMLKYSMLLRGFQDVLKGATGANVNYGTADALAQQAMLPVEDVKLADQLKRQAAQEKRAESAEERANIQLQNLIENSKAQRALTDINVQRGMQQLDMGNIDLEILKQGTDASAPISKVAQDYLKKLNPQLDPKLIESMDFNTISKVSKPIADLVMQEARNKIAAEAAARQERSMQLREQELGIKEKAEERRGDQFKHSVEEKNQEQSAKIVNSFEKDDVVKKANSSIASADNVISLVTSKNPIGHAAVPTFMARASGEVGNLSEADKAPFGGSQALIARIEQVKEQYVNGLLTPENQKFVIDLANVMKKSAQRNKLTRALSLNKKYAKTYNMDINDVNELMIPELNKLTDKDREAVKWALAHPENEMSGHILKMNGF